MKSKKTLALLCGLTLTGCVSNIEDQIDPVYGIPNKYVMKSGLYKEQPKEEVRYTPADIIIRSDR